MLPKIIHYCWFGGNEKSNLIKKCIESWKKFCPDYQIMEWSEDNFDVNCCQYVQEAYAAKKWAFVSDYCRFFVLKQYGGIYLDTDVELLKPLDEFLDVPFMGFEDKSKLNPGLICGCEIDDEVCDELLKEYNQDVFLLQDGTFNLRTVCHRATDEFVKRGLVLNNTLQKIDGYMIYPTEYFNPYNMQTGKISVQEKTVSIHHYAGSWVDKKSRFRGKIHQWITRIFGEKFAAKMRKIFGRKK